MLSCYIWELIGAFVYRLYVGFTCIVQPTVVNFQQCKELEAQPSYPRQLSKHQCKTFPYIDAVHQCPENVRVGVECQRHNA